MGNEVQYCQRYRESCRYDCRHGRETENPKGIIKIKRQILKYVVRLWFIPKTRRKESDDGSRHGTDGTVAVGRE